MIVRSRKNGSSFAATRTSRRSNARKTVEARTGGGVTSGMVVTRAFSR